MDIYINPLKLLVALAPFNLKVVLALFILTAGVSITSSMLHHVLPQNGVSLLASWRFIEAHRRKIITISFSFSAVPRILLIIIIGPSLAMRPSKE
jgi:hypothetical protein